MYFLDLFSYKYVERKESHNIFRDCIILRSFESFKEGEKYDSIIAEITLYAWEKDNANNNEGSMTY